MGLTTENPGDADRHFRKHCPFEVPTRAAAVFMLLAKPRSSSAGQRRDSLGSCRLS